MSWFQNHPQPFQTGNTIEFSNLKDESIKIWRYQIKGRENDYWNEINNLHEVDYENHVPSVAIHHYPNTCFIATAVEFLEIALSYVKDKTTEERRLYNVLQKAIFDNEYHLQEMSFITNMQCLVFNPILALNQRNRELILKNIPIVREFLPYATLKEIIDYNFAVLRRVLKIKRDISDLNYNIDVNAFKTLFILSSILYLIIILIMSILCKKELNKGVNIE